MRITSWGVLIFLWGCVPIQGATKTATQTQPLEESYASSRCAKPPAEGQQFDAKELMGIGSDYLNTALQFIESPISRIYTFGAIDCFGRALRLVPESYEARVGMGVAYLANARSYGVKNSKRKNFLNGARSMLGHAYMLRHGAYEPLYYLAEIAFLEGRFELAHEFLTPLQATGVKEGPVNMLLGRLSEAEGKRFEARTFYRRAASIGWPAETASYATRRLAILTKPSNKDKISNAK